jgi:hypothetical protein
MTATNAKHSSEKVEHYTPPEIIRSAKNVMGSIELDVASCAIANRLVRADRYYEILDDAIDEGTEWAGKTVWCNPPGGKIKQESSAAVYGRKLIDSHQSGIAGQCMFMGFSLEIMQTCQPLLYYPHCIPEKRLKFWIEKEPGILVRGTRPTHANVIFYLPPINSNGAFYRLDVNKFFTEFAKYGTVLMGTHTLVE